MTGLKAVATITIRAAAQMRPDWLREAMGTVIGSLGSQVDESRRGATGVANPDILIWILFVNGVPSGKS